MPERKTRCIYRDYFWPVARVGPREPALQGKLGLAIEPLGLVSNCEVASSEMEDPKLKLKLVQRVKLFRFVQKDVANVTTTKAIDFFPA